MNAAQGRTGRIDVEQMVEYGRDAGHGNLLGIQPYLRPPDYASGKALYARLSGYLDVARRREWLTDKTIVVLPEHTGTWLIAAKGGPGMVRATTIEGAMRALVIHHPLATLGALVRSVLGLAGRPRDVVKASLFQVKAAQLAATYHDVFARLARTYGATIVAGSIVLPAPRVLEGRLVAGRGALYNVSVVYRPDGTPYPDLARKAFPIADELGFTAPAPVDELPVYPAPAGWVCWSVRTLGTPSRTRCSASREWNWWPCPHTCPWMRSGTSRGGVTPTGYPRPTWTHGTSTA